MGEPLWAVDPDSTNLAYSLIGADGDEDFFTIDKETGQLRIKAALDYETKRIYNLVVRVRDNQGADTINVTIELTGEPEPAVTPTPAPEPTADAHANADCDAYAAYAGIDCGAHAKADCDAHAAYAGIDCGAHAKADCDAYTGIDRDIHA